MSKSVSIFVTLITESPSLLLSETNARWVMTSGTGSRVVDDNRCQAPPDHRSRGHAELAKSVKEFINADELTMVADCRYFEGQQLLACDEAIILSAASRKAPVPFDRIAD